MGVLFIFTAVVYWMVFIYFYKNLEHEYPDVWKAHKPNVFVYLNMNPFFVWDVFLIKTVELNGHLKTTLWLLRGLVLLVVLLFALSISENLIRG
jgi:hypothetical protein